jgi:hypothetical protein
MGLSIGSSGSTAESPPWAVDVCDFWAWPTLVTAITLVWGLFSSIWAAHLSPAPPAPIIKTSQDWVEDIFSFIAFIRAPPLAKKTASLIKKETLKKRISNIE